MGSTYTLSTERTKKGLRVNILYSDGTTAEAEIKESDSPNPAMKILNPIGFDVVRDILGRLKKPMFAGPAFTLAFGGVADKIRVDAAVQCGSRIEGLAWISEQYGAVPSIQVPKPLGLNAIASMMEEWMEKVNKRK